jgi:SAM-dependent methyltransferase
VTVDMAEFYNRTRRSSSIGKKLLRSGRLLELPIYWLLRTSDLAREGFENSGSYRFADHIYRNQPSGKYFVGRWLDRRILKMQAVESFRNRFFMARDELARFLEARIEDTESVDVLSVPCGIPRDLVAAGDRHRARGGSLERVRFHILDLDEQVLDQAGQFASEHGIAVTVHRGDALDIRSYDRQYDFITSTGFGEFLDDSQLKQLYGVFHRLLRPGGVFVSSAMRRLPLADYLLRLAELKVHYRSAGDLALHAQHAGFVEVCTSSDDCAIQGFLKAIK